MPSCPAESRWRLRPFNDGDGFNARMRMRPHAISPGLMGMARSDPETPRGRWIPFRRGRYALDGEVPTGAMWAAMVRSIVFLGHLVFMVCRRGARQNQTGDFGPVFRAISIYYFVDELRGVARSERRAIHLRSRALRKRIPNRPTAIAWMRALRRPDKPTNKRAS